MNSTAASQATTPPIPRYKSKTLATWLALFAGSLGAHRFYLHGAKDLWAWVWPWPTLVGVVGVLRARSLGQDDQLAWALIPFLGVSLSAALLAAIVCGLTTDDKWNERFNATSRPHVTGWSTVIGVVLALLIGGAVLMSTIAYSAEHFFRHQQTQALPR
jgi:TM2 domain-containing membrane protein YozV